ncbi:MAG: kinase-like domain-containing protein [Monoraphidium minutum]|nr:MAG: kinase-like domain-containing protein [Monoraphidium minutum]
MMLTAPPSHGPTACGPRLPARCPSNRVAGPHAPGRCLSRPRALPLELLSGDMADAAAQLLLHHAPLAATPVASPCSLMNCGDVIHRSTLDPILRKEVGGPSWQAFALLAAAGAYLFSTPGVLPGAYDYYIGSRLQAKKLRAIDKSDLTLGKKLGSGAFGSVYRATMTPEAPGAPPADVIVKKAKEFGEAEVWMNERMSRASPGVIAEFVSAFEEGAAEPIAGPAAGMGILGRKKAPEAGSSDPAVWLVWKDEGGPTLWDMMQGKRGADFPYNLEPLLLGRELKLPRGKRRRLVTLKLAMRQLMEGLRDCHATGIVHRDFKPQNTIVSANSKRLKLIDFGAAADLRLGINYVPNEYLLDPRYAPPQQYIMSRQTPRPPPKPVAALLSPILWAMEGPDKFDMYSAGITLLQLAFPALRSDNGLIAFNKRLKDCNWDLARWRKEEGLSKRNDRWPKELEEGFEVLDADGGLGWDLACKLVAYKPSDRLSAAAVLSHPWLAAAPAAEPAPGSTALVRAGAVAGGLSSSVGTVLTKTAESVGSAGGSLMSSMEELLPPGLVEDALTASNRGALTEAFLLQEFGDGSGDAPRPPAPPRDSRQTIAWWQGREQERARKLEGRKGGGGGSGKPTPEGTPEGTRSIKRAAAGGGKGAKAGGNGKPAPAGGGGSGGKAAGEGSGAVSRVRDLLNVFGRQ